MSPQSKGKTPEGYRMAPVITVAEKDFWGRYADSGVVFQMMNGSTVKGQLLDWDPFSILVQGKSRKYLVRKQAVRLYAPIGEPAEQPKESAAKTDKKGLDRLYFSHHVNAGTKLRFAFTDGKGITATAVNYDSYSIEIVTEGGQHFLLPKHAWAYCYKLSEEQMASEANDEVAASTTEP